jgi:hypothetical protein
LILTKKKVHVENIFTVLFFRNVILIISILSKNKKKLAHPILLEKDFLIPKQIFQKLKPSNFHP